ncbi:MAG TPA: hypothetical protein PLN91_00730 [Rhodanobacteraceae bacterium]|nr:hypothetical protein [Rhodanobacteraceae bacterium]
MVDKDVLKGFNKKAATASDQELCAIEAGLRAYMQCLDSGSDNHRDAHRALVIILREKLAREEVRTVRHRRAR